MSEDNSLKCSCGGDLVETNNQSNLDEVRKLDREFCGPTPKHKKKRILKKLYKKFYAKRFKSPHLMQLMVAPLVSPNFKCSSCNETCGYYKAMGMNMLKIEKLSEEDIIANYKGPIL